MIKSIFNLILFEPLYNALVFLTGILPGANVGLAIILLTVIVRIILFPLYQKTINNQKQMALVQPEIKKIKEKYKAEKQKQAEAILELYKEHNMNPFSGILVTLIQIPIILSMFFVFSRGFDLNLDILYSFISQPEVVNTQLLGFLDITQRSFIIAFLVAASQYLQMNITLPKPSPKTKKSDNKPNFQEDMVRGMQTQMRYVLPGVIGIIATTFPAAVGIYWITSNVFSLGQFLMVKRKKEDQVESEQNIK
ncbi:MAG: YidC/Oxa1 family membrane protein insertase [Patescibacteria group bacterium]